LHFDETATLTESTPPLGAIVRDDGRCEFRVWAPQVDKVELHIVAPVDQRIALTRNMRGYHEAVVDAGAGTRYFFVINGRERPDPASRSQPDGVHEASEVVARVFDWHDAAWRGVPLEHYVIYELHVGTFTDAGTFDAVVEHLDDLSDLGITAIELMPIGQFSGTRNWGYDGVFVGAAQNSYGGPLGLKRLVDACHARGLALLLDVVYNHLGPEGNYLAEYGPYFTDRYKTPWGDALNFDGPHSDDVRWFFIHNALQWIDEFHIDGLRVDAVHAIVDRTAEPFLQDLTTAVRERGNALGRHVYTFAESNLNDPRVITPKDALGLGFDSQWSDDFHHSLRTLLTAETSGYYAGYGRTSDLARTLTSGYLYTGQHSVYRGRKHGLAPKTREGKQFVVFAQNHDQVGNRMTGDRLAATVSLAKVRIAAAAVILTPFIPMLFMGEEYGETAPFQYFTSHADRDLIEAVRRGRHKEFERFQWSEEPPDPHDIETFLRSKLRREPLDEIHALYKELLQLRASTPALGELDLDTVETHADDEQRTLLIKRRNTLLAFNFSDASRLVEVPFGDTTWTAIIETSVEVNGNVLTMPPESFGLFQTSVLSPQSIDEIDVSS
jgi:maltooligosyltrehalose trehalohydrolase